MADRIDIDDEDLIDIIRDLVDNAKLRAELGLELGKVVVPTISLNSVTLYELINVSVAISSTQVLEEGIYALATMTDAYAASAQASGGAHYEIYAGGGWRDWGISDATEDAPLLIISDGTNVRMANGSGAQAFRFVGVRVYD